MYPTCVSSKVCEFIFRNRNFSGIHALNFHFGTEVFLFLCHTCFTFSFWYRNLSGTHAFDFLFGTDISLPQILQFFFWYRHFSHMLLIFFLVQKFLWHIYDVDCLFGTEILFLCHRCFGFSFGTEISLAHTTLIFFLVQKSSC